MGLVTKCVSSSHKHFVQIGSSTDRGRTKSISPSLGDPDETCRQGRDEQSGRSGCFHAFPTLLLLSRPCLPWDQGSHSYHPLKLSVSDRRGTVLTAEKKRNPLCSDIGRINCGHPELETFNGNISHNQPVPVIGKKIYISIKAASN